MKKGVAAVGAIVGLLIAIIILTGVAIPVVVDSSNTLANLTSVVNESVVATNNTYNTLAYYPVNLNTANPVRFRNTTGPTTQFLNETTNYAWQSKDTTNNRANGTVLWVNIPADWNCSSGVGKVGVTAALKASYGWESQNYQTTGSTGRLVLGLLPTFVVLVLLVAIGLAVVRRVR